MKTGNACFLLLMCVSLLFTSCGNSQSKKGEENKVGDDKDAHGCIASAGYTWSEVLKDCIRLWEKGVRVADVADKEKAAYIINLDAHITLHFHLATQTPMILHLFAAEMRNFRRQNLATAIQYLAFALSARTLTTTSGRKEYTVHRQRIQQRGTGSYIQYIIAVDSQFYIT